MTSWVNQSAFHLALRSMPALVESKQFFKPENYFGVREALLKAGRGDLIGSGCDCLIPAQPPKAAIDARRRRANEVAEGDHYHSVANPAKGEPAGNNIG